MKKIVSLLLSLSVLFSVFSFMGITSHAVTEDVLTFTLNDDGASYSVSDCKENAEGEMVIPSSYNDMPVTSVGFYAFEYCTKLTSIIIPDTVKSISPFAFPYCFNLTSITIPDSVETISDFAFNGDFRLSVINIGAGVNNLSEMAFDNCFGLTEINVSEGNTILSSVDGVLFNKDKTNLMKYPVASTRTTYSVPEGVEKICMNAFSSSNVLTEVILPESLQRIEDYAFYSCSKLTSIIIPDNVTYVGYFSFAECNALEDITIGAKVELIAETAFEMCTNIKAMNVSGKSELYSSVDGVLFDKDKQTLLKYPIAKETENYIIPDGVTHISENAFLSCNTVKNITFPDSLTSVGIKAFCGCGALSSVVFGKGLDTIGKMAFANTGLKSISIPDSVTTIGQMAFLSSFELTTAHIGANSKIGSAAFKGCESLSEFTVSDENPDYAVIDGVIFSKDKTTLLVYPWGYKEKPYVVPSGVTTIGTSAFEGCYKLISAVLSEDVELIEKNAFAVCESLDSIVFTKGLKEISNNAFRATYVGSIFYTGTEEEWNAITIGESGNEVITDTNKHFGTVEHTPSDWILDNPPCIDGYKHNQCVVCSRKLETVSQSATAEHMESGWIVGANPTVDAPGYNYTVCTQCGREVKRSETSQLLPSTPSKLSAVRHVDGVSFTWGAVKGADNYVVYRKTKNSKWVNVGEVKANSFIDKTAKTGVTYTYTVRAENEKGRSGYQNKGVSVTFVASPKLKSIANSSSAVTVKWSKASGVDGYIVYRKPYGGTTWTRLELLKGDSKTSYSDKKVSAGKTYIYTVKAYKGKLNSAYNKSGIAITRLLEPALASVKNTSTGVNITWKKVSGAKSYIVYRKTAKSGWSKVGTSKELTFTDTTAKSGTTYTYTVKAQGLYGVGLYNKTGVSLKYLAAPVLSKIDNETGGVRVTWKKVGGANGYLVYRKTTNPSAKYEKIADIKNGNTVSFKDTKAKSGVQYIYTVKAYNGKVNSGYNAKGVTISYLSTPVLSSVTSVDDEIVIKWKAVSGAEGYYVYKKVQGDSWEKIGTVMNGKTVTLTDSSFESGVTYVYTVRAYKGSDRSFYDKKGLTITI